MKRLGLMILLLGLAAFFAQANVIAGTEEELRALIDYIFGDDVTVAALSADFPLNFDLPVPENTQIIASTVWERQNDVDTPPQKSMRVMLRSNAIHPRLIGEFYQDYFRSNDWEELQFVTETTNGFYGTNTITGQYCLGRDYYMDFRIWTSALDETEALDWEINIYANPSDAECQVINDNYILLTDFFPQFEPVEGIELLSYAGMNTMHIPQISATYVTGMRFSLPLSTVFAAYNEQIRAEGWTELSQELGTSFAISDWIIHTDTIGDIQGRLVILQKTAQSNEYTAYLSLEQ